VPGKWSWLCFAQVWRRFHPIGSEKGVISMNDIVLASQGKEGPAPADIVSTLSAICAHRPAKVAAA